MVQSIVEIIQAHRSGVSPEDTIALVYKRIRAHNDPAIFIALARPMVVALLERGAFSSGDATVVAHTVAGFSLGLVPFSIYLFSLRAFYSLQDTRTPFYLNCFENALNIALAFPLYKAFGVPGLGLNRGLGDELVIAPYATALAAMINPQQSATNFRRLVLSFHNSE